MRQSQESRYERENVAQPLTLVIMRFQLFFMRLPLFSTLNISSSATGRTYITNTRDHLLLPNMSM